MASSRRRAPRLRFKAPGSVAEKRAVLDAEVATILAESFDPAPPPSWADQWQQRFLLEGPRDSAARAILREANRTKQALSKGQAHLLGQGLDLGKWDGDPTDPRLAVLTPAERHLAERCRKALLAGTPLQASLRETIAKQERWGEHMADLSSEFGFTFFYFGRLIASGDALPITLDAGSEGTTPVGVPISDEGKAITAARGGLLDSEAHLRVPLPVAAEFSAPPQLLQEPGLLTPTNLVPLLEAPPFVVHPHIEAGQPLRMRTFYWLMTPVRVLAAIAYKLFPKVMVGDALLARSSPMSAYSRSCVAKVEQAYKNYGPLTLGYPGSKAAQTRPKHYTDEGLVDAYNEWFLRDLVEEFEARRWEDYAPAWLPWPDGFRDTVRDNLWSIPFVNVFPPKR